MRYEGGDGSKGRYLVGYTRKNLLLNLLRQLRSIYRAYTNPVLPVAPAPFLSYHVVADLAQQAREWELGRGLEQKALCSISNTYWLDL